MIVRLLSSVRKICLESRQSTIKHLFLCRSMKMLSFVYISALLARTSGCLFDWKIDPEATSQVLHRSCKISEIHPAYFINECLKIPHRAESLAKKCTKEKRALNRTVGIRDAQIRALQIEQELGGTFAKTFKAFDRWAQRSMKRNRFSLRSKTRQPLSADREAEVAHSSSNAKNSVSTIPPQSSGNADEGPVPLAIV